MLFTAPRTNGFRAAGPRRGAPTPALACTPWSPWTPGSLKDACKGTKPSDSSEPLGPKSYAPTRLPAFPILDVSTHLIFRCFLCSTRTLVSSGICFFIQQILPKQLLCSSPEARCCRGHSEQDGPGYPPHTHPSQSQCCYLARTCLLQAPATVSLSPKCGA